MSIAKVKFDMTRLNVTMAKWAAELKLSADQVVKYQAGLLLKDLVAFSPPKNLQRLQKNIQRDVGKVFAPAPSDAFTGKQRGHGDMIWLASGPRWLLGVQPLNYHVQDTVADMGKLYRRVKVGGSQVKENAQTQIGVRGPQSVYKWNRLVVKRAAMRDFVALLKKSGGKFKASWAVAWDYLQPAGHLPQWVKKHVDARTAPGRFEGQIGLPGIAAKFTFISNAPGCTKEEIVNIYRGALMHRIEAMKADLKNMAAGAYNRSGFKQKMPATQMPR